MNTSVMVANPLIPTYLSGVVVTLANGNKVSGSPSLRAVAGAVLWEVTLSREYMLPGVIQITDYAVGRGRTRTQAIRSAKADLRRRLVP